MKPNKETIQYIRLFPALDYLETKRKGIRKRVWNWIISDKSDYKDHRNGLIYHMNLFYFGPKDESDKADYVGVFDWVKENPEDIELQKDFHLIWEEFVDKNEDIEMFYYML